MAPLLSRLGVGGSGGFGFGRKKSVSLREFIQYYLFTSPGSLNTTSVNNFGFVFSPTAIVNLLTIGDGSSGAPGSLWPGPPGSLGGNIGGSSGTVVIRNNVPLATVAPGGSLPYTLGTISGGVSIGSTSGGGGGQNYAGPGGNYNGMPGNPGLFPGLTPYLPQFQLYSITDGSGGTGGTGNYYGGPIGSGGGGGAGGLIVTKASPDTPLIYGTPAPSPITASSGGSGGIANPGSPEGSSPRSGGGGGLGGTGYGAGGGGGGGPVENWGNVGPAGGGGAGAGGIFIIKISESR